MAETDCLVGDEGDLTTKVSPLICSRENICDTICGKPRDSVLRSTQGRLPFQGGAKHPREQAVLAKA